MFALFVSCKEETLKPKVIYEDKSKSKSELKVDSSKIKVADLPIIMEGTTVLLHPIGELSVSKSSDKYESSSYRKDQSFVVSNSSEYEITGYLSNFKFQQIGSDSLTILTNKPVLIERATYLKALAYHGLGQTNAGLQLLEQIAHVHPNYRSTDALIIEWKNS